MITSTEAIVLKRSTKMKVRFIMAKNTNATTTAATETPANTNATTIVAAPSKADKARAIFNEGYAMNPVPDRKVFIQRYMAEAGLTKNGAATYHQNMKAKAGYVTSKASAVATA